MRPSRSATDASIALHFFASHHCDLNQMRLLLEAGADVNLTSRFGTPLQMVVWIGNLEAIELLVEFGADLSLEFEVGWACSEDRKSAVINLIRHFRVAQEEKELRTFIPDPVPNSISRRRM